MLPKILQSNYPLSGHSRARLLKQRASQLLELKSIKISIDVDRTLIVENKSAITSIEYAIKRLWAALAAYNSNINALTECKSRLMSISSTHKEGSTPVERDPSPTYLRAHALVSSGASNELRQVNEQQKNLRTRIIDINSMLSSLEQELHGHTVELAVRENSLMAHTTFMHATSSTLETIKDVLSPIRQMPSEIWEEIFRIMYTEVGEKWDHVLPVSQVCQEWSAISLGLTRLWTRIAIHPVPWWPQAEIDRLMTLLSRASRRHTTLIVHLQSTQNWESQALASELLGSLYLHEEHVYYETEEENTSTSSGNLRYSMLGSQSSTWGPQSPAWRHPTKHRREIQKFKSTYQRNYSGTERRDLIRILPSLLLQHYSVHFYLGPESEQLEQRSLSIPFNAPESITIEAPTPRQGIFSNILSSFDKVSRLTLLNVSPKTPNQLIGKLREVKYLRFSTSRMVPFDISPLLSLSLEELHVEHSCDNTFPQLASIIELPKLHTLAITLHEHSLCSMLEFPTLQMLILHSSAPAHNLASALGFFKSESHFGGINHLRFCDWDAMDSSSAVIEIVKNIMMASMHLTELTFTNCRLEMPNLISVVNSNDSSLKVINLVCCVGITQADCESLRLNVERLTIWV